MVSVMTITHPAKIKDGKMSLQSREVFEAGVKAMPDGDYILNLEPIKGKRSLQQLRGLMGVWMATILESLGYGAHDKDFVYQEIKIAIGYCEPKAIPGTGEQKKVPVRTSGFDKDKYRKFMDDFQRYVEDVDTGLGIRLPDLDPMKARI